MTNILLITNFINNKILNLTNKKIIVIVKNNNKISYKEESFILSNVAYELSYKKYFFTINYSNYYDLQTENIYLFLGDIYKYIYLNVDINNIEYVNKLLSTNLIVDQYFLYVTPKLINIPIFFLGLKNFINEISINFNINYLLIDNSEGNIIETITFDNVIFSTTQIFVDGFITKFTNILLDDINSFNNLTQILNPEIYDQFVVKYLNLYIYNTDYLQITNIIKKTTIKNSFTINLQLFNNTTLVYSYISSLNIDTIDITYTSLYEYVLFFKQLLNINITEVKIIYFDYDYFNYFKDAFYNENITSNIILNNNYLILTINQNNIKNYLMTTDDNKTFKINMNLSEIISGDEIINLNGHVFNIDNIKLNLINQSVRLKDKKSPIIINLACNFVSKIFTITFSEEVFKSDGSSLTILDNNNDFILRLINGNRSINGYTILTSDNKTFNFYYRMNGIIFNGTEKISLEGTVYDLNNNGLVLTNQNIDYDFDLPPIIFKNFNLEYYGFDSSENKYYLLYTIIFNDEVKANNSSSFIIFLENSNPFQITITGNGDPITVTNYNIYAERTYTYIKIYFTGTLNGNNQINFFGTVYNYSNNLLLIDKKLDINITQINNTGLYLSLPLTIFYNITSSVDDPSNTFNYKNNISYIMNFKAMIRFSEEVGNNSGNSLIQNDFNVQIISGDQELYEFDFINNDDISFEFNIKVYGIPNGNEKLKITNNNTIYQKNNNSVTYILDEEIDINYIQPYIKSKLTIEPDNSQASIIFSKKVYKYDGISEVDKEDIILKLKGGIAKLNDYTILGDNENFTFDLDIEGTPNGNERLMFSCNVWDSDQNNLSIVELNTNLNNYIGNKNDSLYIKNIIGDIGLYTGSFTIVFSQPVFKSDGITPLTISDFYLELLENQDTFSLTINNNNTEFIFTKTSDNAYQQNNNLIISGNVFDSNGNIFIFDGQVINFRDEQIPIIIGFLNNNQNIINIIFSEPVYQENGNPLTTSQLILSLSSGTQTLNSYTITITENNKDFIFNLNLSGTPDNNQVLSLSGIVYDITGNSLTFNQNLNLINFNVSQSLSVNQDNELSITFSTEVYQLYNYPITNNYNLYNLIIESDSTLSVPIILYDINFDNYIIKILFDTNELEYSDGRKEKINLDLQNINKFVSESKTDLFSRYINNQSSDVNLITEYLNNYEMKTYNVYKIINNNKYLININNIITNCIIVKLVFVFYLNNIRCTYSVTGKLFLDNYSFQFYHKNYEKENDEIKNKKDLIKLLFYILLNYVHINIFFYNSEDDENINNFLYNSIISNQYYKFNNLILPRVENKVKLKMIIEENKYLKLSLNLNLNYYILFFISKLTVLSLKFYVNNNYFFINRIGSDCVTNLNNIINNPNGNLNITQFDNIEYTNLYYIAFQNITEINIFLNYIETGIFNQNIKKIKNFYDIDESKKFKKNTNDYYIIDNENQFGSIYFNIDKLKIDKNYLYNNYEIRISN